MLCPSGDIAKYSTLLIVRQCGDEMGVEFVRLEQPGDSEAVRQWGDSASVRHWVDGVTVQQWGNGVTVRQWGNEVE